MNLKQQHINTIYSLCKIHKVEKLYLFGSVLTDNFSTKSDVDFLVKFKKTALHNYFTNYLSFKTKLSNLLKRDVDLVEEQTLKNPILLQNINSQKKLIYG